LHSPYGHPRRTLSGTLALWSPDFPHAAPITQGDGPFVLRARRATAWLTLADYSNTIFPGTTQICNNQAKGHANFYIFQSKIQTNQERNEALFAEWSGERSECALKRVHEGRERGR